MKDRQIQQGPLQMRVPFVSAALHCVSMTVIVFLRSSFGYSYLRPKSVFFAFAWAFVLFFIYAWKEKDVWQEYRLMCLYGGAAIFLYLTHMIRAFFGELFRGGAHDNDSGTPHTLRVLRMLGRPCTPQFEMKWHIWVEPIFVFLAGLFLGVVVQERHLSYWLVFTAPCLSVKESLNYWFQVRQKKRHKDSRDDAEDIFEDEPTTTPADAPKPIGKTKIRRARASTLSAAHEITERQYAQVLRLMPPYRLDEAERNYERLIKYAQPDQDEGLDSDGGLAAQLNEAISFFRRTHG